MENKEFDYAYSSSTPPVEPTNESSNRDWEGAYQKFAQDHPEAIARINKLIELMTKDQNVSVREKEKLLHNYAFKFFVDVAKNHNRSSESKGNLDQIFGSAMPKELVDQIHEVIRTVDREFEEIENKKERPLYFVPASLKDPASVAREYARISKKTTSYNIDTTDRRNNYPKGQGNMQEARR
jgi:hypothetical protein